MEESSSHKQQRPRGGGHCPALAWPPAAAGTCLKAGPLLWGPTAKATDTRRWRPAVTRLPYVWAPQQEVAVMGTMVTA